jgi:hypothetical protein
MKTFQKKLLVASSSAAILASSAGHAGPAAELALDETLAGWFGAPALPAAPGSDARWITTPFGKGAEPETAGPALTIQLPAEGWDCQRGTLGFRMRVSRRIGHVSDGPPPVVTLVKTPALEVVLRGDRDSPHLLVTSTDPKMKGEARSQIACLEPDKWYHFAVSWRADTGEADLFLNGWAQEHIHLGPWKVPADADRQIELGGVLGEGEGAARIAVAQPELFAWQMDEAQLRTVLKGRELFDVGSSARQTYDRPMDVSGCGFELIFEPDFSKPLPIINEDTLFEGDERIREPDPGEWVLEGPGKAFVKDGQLVIDNLENGMDHVVLWLPKPFPSDFLLEFDITIERVDQGLAIVFFAARPVDDPAGSIFKKGLPKRNGRFINYIRGDVNSYHVSYIAGGERGSETNSAPRRSTNVRKNSGFWLVACGDDQIQGKGLGPGPHRVRLLKVGNKMQMEVNGLLSVEFEDDGKTWGPVWEDGYIGLRQMNHLLSARYENMKVYRVTD